MKNQQKKNQKYKGFTRATLRHALMWGDFVQKNGHWNKSDALTYLLIREEIKRLGHQYYLDRKQQMNIIKEQPEDITPVVVDAVLMPNGEVICLGEKIGTFEKLKGYIFKK